MTNNPRYWEMFQSMKNTWKQENSFWVKQALNVSRHCPADLMLRAASAPILFVGAQLVGLLLTTRTLQPAPVAHQAPKQPHSPNHPEAEVASCWEVMMEASDSAWLGADQPLCSQCLSRWATFSLAMGECRISDMDQHTVAGTLAFTVSFKTTSCNSSQAGTKELGLATWPLHRRVWATSAWRTTAWTIRSSSVTSNSWRTGSWRPFTLFNRWAFMVIQHSFQYLANHGHIHLDIWHMMGINWANIWDLGHILSICWDMWKIYLAFWRYI